MTDVIFWFENMIDFCISPLLQKNVKRMMAHVNMLKTFTCTYLDFFSRGKGVVVIIWLSRGWVWHLFVCNFTILNILWSTYDYRFPDALTHKYNKKCYQKTKLIMLIWLHLQSRTGNIKMTFLISLSFFTKVMYIGCLSACSLTHTGLMTIIYTLHRFYHWRYYMHILSNDLPYQ